MRLGLKTWNPIEKLLITFGVIPTPLLYGFWGMASSRTLMAGVELGVFDTLAKRPCSAEEIAREIECDPTGTEALLNSLNGFGYLKRKNGLYRNSRTVRRWLQADSRFPMTGGFGLFRILWDELTDVEDRLRSGEARDFHQDRDERFWSRYQGGLAQFARLTSAEIVRRVKFDGKPTNLLDIGGGHGTYSSAFCRKYPGLHAEIIDLPGAVEIGRELVDEEDLTDRITFRAENLLTADWGKNLDVILLFNVIHILTPEEIRVVFGKARDALRPGGTFVVQDSAHKGSTGNIDTAGGANELLFYVINNTRAYPEEDVAEWMRGAGFAEIRTRHLVTVPQSALTTGRTPKE